MAEASVYRPVPPRSLQLARQRPGFLHPAHCTRSRCNWTPRRSAGRSWARLRGPQALHHIVIPAAFAVGELGNIHLAYVHYDPQPGQVVLKRQNPLIVCPGRDQKLEAQRFSRLGIDPFLIFQDPTGLIQQFAGFQQIVTIKAVAIGGGGSNTVVKTSGGNCALKGASSVNSSALG